jgi:DNA repair protein RecO (recombination protein O)
MKAELENAYVLHSRAFKDTSLLVDFFTENFGRITLVAKGARQQKKKGNFLLQPFVSLKISWQGRGQLKTLTSTEIITATVDADNNEIIDIDKNNNRLEKKYLYSGFYANELLTYLLPFDEPNADIFYLYANLLMALKNKFNLEKILRLFEFSLLSELGYGIDFIHASISGDLIEAGKQYYYDPSEGFVSLNALDTIDANLELGPLVRRHVFDGRVILGVYGQEYNDETVRQAAKYIARKSMDNILLGKKIKSRDFFK